MWGFKNIDIIEKQLPVELIRMDNILIIKQDIGEGISKEIEFEINENTINDFITFFKMLKREM